ncbi:MAG TPA: xanthine dehydrogenase family protein molybdopterin-binding subunit [Candidatus Limnocylindrales bacterium]|nr:xanthine dehydrogenase family protein molybdopterin-binding subunit [Candidatus Limnocylindrales bacterium]
MADYHWPPADHRALIGKREKRIDGPVKSSGRAKYSYDINRPGMLWGKMATSPYAHAKITKIDTSAAEAMPGVKAVVIMVPEGQEVLWAGQEVVALAADSEERAEQAADAIQIDYEPLPYLVTDADPQHAGAQYSKQLEERVAGNPDQGFQQAEVISEGDYGLPVISHCCLESHGQVTEWNGDHLTVWSTTQNVSGIAGEFVQGLAQKGITVAANNVHVISQYMGGGFGSKFAADTWGIACAQLSKKAGRPVKMMLERDQEMTVAGCRPSLHAHVKIGAKRDGTLVAWESQSWGTGGVNSAGTPRIPYVIEVPNVRARHTAILTNIGPARAWRAPNHPQMALVSNSAMEDMAAKLNMDPLDFMLKNINLTGDRAKTYQEEFAKASELMDWKSKWHPRGRSGSGHMKRGLGLSLHTWGGRGNLSNSLVTIHPDGSVETSLGSQDLGTGTRTVIAIVTAETLGLPLDAVKVNIGDNRYPPAGASGGSTTVSGVSTSTRRAATNALNELLAKVAPALGASPDQLEAWGGKIRVTSNPAKSISWKQACAKMGASPITGTGRTSNDLMSSGVGGVQMSEVEVDTETGIVRMVKHVAVQDCGLVIDVRTAESQVYGACIMGVCYSLYEEKIMDQPTGRCLNPNMEFYRLASIGDIGEIVVHMMTGPGYDERGTIGLGEPPVISPGAAISNAVANAIGVRVPELPMTPDRVLAALGTLGKGGVA